MNNPIAALLDITDTTPHHLQVVTIDGRAYEYHPAAECTFEGLYRLNAGHGMSNPCFSLCYTPVSHHAMMLGQYLAGRQGVKRAEAELIVENARATLTIAPKRVPA